MPGIFRGGVVRALPAAPGGRDIQRQGETIKTNPAFPPSRLDEPTRRAERDIYQAVEASPIPGRCLYEVKVTRHARQVDLVVWAEAVATFGVEIKGGLYEIHEGELCLVTDQGLIPKAGLLAAVWDSVMEIPRFIERKLGRGMYIIPVLCLTDIERDEGIMDLAAKRQVEVLFGKHDWVRRLTDLASHHPIRHRPTEATIEAEVMAVMPELAPAPSPTSPQVVIHHVDALHIHVGPDAVEVRDILGLTADA